MTIDELYEQLTLTERESISQMAQMPTRPDEQKPRIGSLFRKPGGAKKVRPLKPLPGQRELFS